VTLTPKRAVRAALLVCALVALLAGSVATAPASAQAPCWKRLLNDWYDGQIQNSYLLSCYQQAIDHLPADVRQYSTAAEDIARARTLAIAERDRQAEAGSGTTTGEEDVVPPPPNTNTTGGETNPSTTSGNPKKKGPIGKAIQNLNPSSPDAFPLPLLILGALAILLLGAGVAGMVWRRYQGERPSSP
jgi:hypothetical protein